MSDATPNTAGRELVIGLVGAIGTDLEMVSSVLSNALRTVDYDSEVIQLSRLLDEVAAKTLPQSPVDDRYKAYMDAGDDFRGQMGRGDALAILGISAVRDSRQIKTGDPNSPIPRHAYILRSLKHPQEAKTLKEVYGPAFILVAAFSPRESRAQNLASRIATSRHESRSDKYRPIAEDLIQRDQAESGNPLGQNVRDTFPLADVFVDTRNREQVDAPIRRFVEILFGHPFHTPTRDEYGMFHAQASALRSAALGRQVGAVIATEDCDIIAVGTNEVPKAGGGLYWCGDQPDGRDFTLDHDTNDRMKRGLFANIIERLKKNGWLNPVKTEMSVDELVNEALSGDGALMKGSQLMSLIEFGRIVHAEMAALMDAARRGVAVRGCTLYTTTYPCHDCAKHIVAAGIDRVVYIEPYPKSLVPELYPDSIEHEFKAGAGAQNSL